MSTATDGLDLDVGFTLGLDLPFAESVAFAAREGFDFVELLLDARYARERIEDRAAELRETLSTYDCGVVVHLPFAVDPGSPFEPVRAGAVEELTLGMDLAGDLGADRVVFHPSSDAWSKGWDTTATRAFVHDSLDELLPAANDRGLEPCLENIVSSYYDATTFDELLSRYPDAQMTFDTSHALLAGQSEAEMADFLREHSDRVAHLHLVDTRGDSDEHLPVGMGVIDFERVLEPLVECGWEGTATLEIGTEDYATIALGKENLEGVVEGA